MPLNDDIVKLLDDFNLKLTNDVKRSLKIKLDEKASKHGSSKVTSRLENSAKGLPITITNGVIKLQFQMNDYWDEVNSGRGATEKSGDGSLRKNLVRWIKTRGLKVEISKRKSEKISNLKNKKIKKTYKKQSYEDAVNSMAYAIASKIHKEGFEGNHFFDEIINDGRIEELQKRLSELIKTDIIINISN